MLELTKKLMAEGLISMTEAARLFGSCRSQAPTHPNTVVRKCHPGDRLPDGARLVLEHVRCSNRLMTSRQAVERHVAALTAAFAAAPASALAPRSPARRKRASDAAAAELRRRGS